MGTEPPRTKVPPLACDAHLHIIDPRFPTPETHRPTGMTFDDYAKFRNRMGTTRAVVVQPKYHRTDHSCTLDALARMDGNGRGVGVLRPDVSDAELRRLDQGGIRGLRFSLWNPQDAVVTLDMVEPLAKRIATLGWHVQIHMFADDLVEAAGMLDRLPCPVVFDHLGRLPPRAWISHPAFKIISRMLEKERAWLKLAGAYLNTLTGPPNYDDASRIAKAFVAAAPADRLVWGSDWPHLTENAKPDSAALFDLLAEWVPDEESRHRILVENPARLYGFS